MKYSFSRADKLISLLTTVQHLIRITSRHLPMKPSIPTIVLAVGATLLSPLSSASAGTAEPKEIVAPITPVPPPKWEFTLEPYAWATGMDGTTGVGGIDSHIDVPFNDIIDHIDWAIFLKGEVRTGKWGVIMDGFFAELSDVADPEGPLYTNVNLEVQQGLAQLALAYRVVDGPRGYVDFFAGARYNYLSLDVKASIDDEGIEALSTNLSDAIVESLVSKAEQIVIEDVESLKEQIEAGVETDLEKRLEEISAKIEASNSESHPRLEADGEILRSFAEVARAVAEQRAAILAGEVRESELERLDNEVDKAEQNLADTVDEKIQDALPKEVSGNEQWIDPIVGVRGQYNFNEHFFAAVYGDIGGFGIGSDLTWQVSGSLGYNFNKNVFTELGYRYLQIDYSDGGFEYDVATSGFFVGLGFNF